MWTKPSHWHFLSVSKVNCSYAWQDSSGTPRWCAGTAPCSRRCKHSRPVALWCSSPSLSATGNMPFWAAITHWRRSISGTPRGAGSPRLRSWTSRHLVGFLCFSLTTVCSCWHPASREKLRYTSTSWSIWAIKHHQFGTNCVHYHVNTFSVILLTLSVPLESTSNGCLCVIRKIQRSVINYVSWL